MVKKSQTSSTRKRKAGHLNFQAGEIAFIEDEMAALAAEYGLDLDKDVAIHVQQRHQKKKTRRRQLRDCSKRIETVSEHKTSATLVYVKLLDVKTNHNAHEEGDEAQLALKRLARVLPDTCALRACGVPGCSCVNGSKSVGLLEKDEIENPKKDVIEKIQCLKCQHGVLQHSVVVREDMDSPAGMACNGGQQLLQMLFQIIRLGRIGASIFKSRMWTKSALERLQVVLMHLKRQIATGGTQNGQKSVIELHQERQLLSDLQTQLRKVEQVVGTASRDELPILLACLWDRMYFQTYYAALVMYGRACGAVPSPQVYLKDLDEFTPDSTVQLEKFLNRELFGLNVPSRLIKSLALPVASSTSQDELARQRLRAAQHESDNPLLAIYHSRLREGVRLFYEEGVGMDGEMDAVVAAPKGSDLVASKKLKASKKPQKKHYRRERNNSSRTGGEAEGATSSVLVEMPSYPLLAEWRNTCRDWCCHLYAYATPTQEALDVMAKYAPIVEVGAGTGYWSSLLQRANVDVVAYDKAPPSAEGAEGNAYHGHVPPFCSVGRGGPEVLSQESMAGRTLFLCYPPPGDAMAVRSVQLFQGDVILHVGEWQGDTGDGRFESELQRRFVLEEEITLPNWGNSAYGLTVWRRKLKDIKPVFWRAMSCFHCDKTLKDAAAARVPLRRCVICKTNVYCSSICAQQDAVGHAAEHAARLVFLTGPTSSTAHDRMFKSDAFYRELREPNLDDTVMAIKSNWNALVKSESSTGNEANSNKDKSHNEDNEEDSEDEPQSANITTKAAFAFNFGA